MVAVGGDAPQPVANWTGVKKTKQVLLRALALEEGPDHGWPVRFFRRRTQEARVAPVGLRDDVSAAVNGDQLNLDRGVVPPHNALDANAVADVGLTRLRRGRDVI